MGMLLYMMEQQSKEKAKGVAEKVTPAPVSQSKPEKKERQEAPVAEAKKPTRVDIMRMNVATVRAYAETQGVEGANAMSGAELKRLLVNKMIEESE